MHISPRLANAAARTATPAFTPHVRRCLCCPVKFWASNSEQLGCSSHRGEAWRKNAKAIEEAAAETLRKEAARREEIKTLEQVARAALLEGVEDPEAVRLSGRQVIVSPPGGGISVTFCLSKAEVAAIAAARNNIRASAPSN